MPALLITDIPREVYEWLKREAERNRRSMTQQAIVVLEERMRGFHPVRFREASASEPLMRCRKYKDDSKLRAICTPKEEYPPIGKEDRRAEHIWGARSVKWLSEVLNRGDWLLARFVLAV